MLRYGATANTRHLACLQRNRTDADPRSATSLADDSHTRFSEANQRIGPGSASAGEHTQLRPSRALRCSSRRPAERQPGGTRPSSPAGSRLRPRKPRDTGLMAGQLLSRNRGLSSVGGTIPALKAVHIVKDANSARTSPAGPFCPKGFARAAVRVMGWLRLVR